FTITSRRSMRRIEPFAFTCTASPDALARRTGPGALTAGSPPRASRSRARSAGPAPRVGARQVDAVLVRLPAARVLEVAQPDLHVRAGDEQAGHAVDRVDREAVAVDLVLDRELEGRVDVALLLVAAHVEVRVVRAPVGEPVDQPGVAVEVEDDRPIR